MSIRTVFFCELYQKKSLTTLPIVILFLFVFQAHKSKTLITDINNRYLDENAKYEVLCCYIK